LSARKHANRFTLIMSYSSTREKATAIKDIVDQLINPKSVKAIFLNLRLLWVLTNRPNL